MQLACTRIRHRKAPFLPPTRFRPFSTHDHEVAAKGADDLSKISGVRPVIVGKLEKLGITTFQQIADFTADDIARIDEELNFKGRIERDDWVKQAKEFLEG